MRAKTDAGSEEAWGKVEHKEGVALADKQRSQIVSKFKFKARKIGATLPSVPPTRSNATPRLFTLYNVHCM